MNFLANLTERTTSVIDNKRYIVVRYYNELSEWDIVYESKEGLSKTDAETVLAYEVRLGKVNPNNLMIVEVPDI